MYSGIDLILPRRARAGAVRAPSRATAASEAEQHHPASATMAVRCRRPVLRPDPAHAPVFFVARLHWQIGKHTGQQPHRAAGKSRGRQIARQAHRAAGTSSSQQIERRAHQAAGSQQIGRPAARAAGTSGDGDAQRPPPSKGWKCVQALSSACSFRKTANRWAGLSGTPPDCSFIV